MYSEQWIVYTVNYTLYTVYPLEIFSNICYNYEVTSLYDRGARERHEESPSITEQGS